MGRASRLLLVLAVVAGVALAVALALGRDTAPDPGRDDAVGAFCASVEGGLPPVDDPGAVDGWRAIEATLVGARRDDAAVARVAAEQIGRLGPDAGFDEVAALALRPEVVSAVLRLDDLRRSTCP